MTEPRGTQFSGNVERVIESRIHYEYAAKTDLDQIKYNPVTALHDEKYTTKQVNSPTDRQTTTTLRPPIGFKNPINTNPNRI